MATYDLTTNTALSTTVTNLIPAAAALTTSGWSTGSYSSAHVLHSASSLQLTGNTGTPEVVSQLTASNIHLIQNHIYYGRIYEYHTASSLTTGCQWQIYWPIAEPSFNSTSFGPANQWNMLSARNSRTSWGTGDYSLRIDFNNNYLAGDVWYNGFMLIDLTADYGSGNEPSTEWCDTNIPFFTGSQSITKLQTGDILNCPYSGTYKSITLPKGTYKLECWGAQGIYSSASPTSSITNGLGGYAKGVINISSPTTFYIYVGGKPGSNINGSTSNYNGGWNGGGGKPSASSYNDNGPGGGATDICLVASACTLTNYAYIRTSASYLSRIIVAGGGGGGRSNNVQMQGGYAPTNTTSSSYNGGMTSGGTTASNSLQAAAFGYGASTNNTSDDRGCGGGGWYGGGSNGDSYGGGGSSFVWCDTYASYVPSGYTPSTSLKMTDVQLTPNTRSGDGYCTITVITTGQAITFNANGGTSTPAAIQFSPGQSVTLPPAITRNTSTSNYLQMLYYNLDDPNNYIWDVCYGDTSYTFAGWNTKSDGTGTNYAANRTITPGESMILYAKWTATETGRENQIKDLTQLTADDKHVQFVITGNGNGGTDKSITATQTIHYQQNGWNTKADKTGTHYSLTSTTSFVGAKAWYAEWEISNSYTNNRVCDIPIPTWQRHAFTGWNTKADGTGTAYPATSTTTFTSATTLYAQWKEIVQYVPYIYNGSSWVKYEIRTNNGTNFNDKYKGSIY